MPVLMTTPSPSSHADVPVVVTGSGSVHSASLSSVSRPAERMRLRPWLIRNIEEKRIPGLEWLDKTEQLVKIPWKHAARHGWTCDKDASLFRAWAIHTKKYDPQSNTPRANPKIWKANFRCAINSLPDILEVKGQGKSKGNDAFKIYKLIPRKAKKTRTASEGRTSQKKQSLSKKSRVTKPVSGARGKPIPTQIFGKSQNNVLAGNPAAEHYVNASAIQARIPGYNLWDEPVRNDISQSQRPTELWNTSIAYTDRLSPIRHDLPLYPSPPLPTQGASSDPLNLTSVQSAPVSSPPPSYPYGHHGTCQPAYGTLSAAHHRQNPLAGTRHAGNGLMEYIAERRQQDDVTNDGYKELQDAESDCSSVPSDEEIVEIVDGMTRDSPLNSPTRTSPFDGNNNSNSSTYWQASTLDDKHFLSDERMIASTSDISMRPPPPDYPTYQGTSHAFKVEGRSSCDYMKHDVYRELSGNRITETSSGTCFYVM